MIRVDVTARQALHLGVRPDAGWLTDTHRFVPGSVLRGALAAVWLAANRPPSPDTTADVEFQRLFEGDVRYGPLYPAPDALRPLSVYGCKYADRPACREVAHDAAFDGPPPDRCPSCDGPTTASKGTVVGDPDLVGHTRVQLDELERAASGQLFTRRALPAGSTVLSGLIDGDIDGDLAWLRDGELPIRLGGRRSTAGLAVLRARAEPTPSSFTGWSADRRTLVVRLLSPGIFVDELGRPSWLPDLGALAELLGVEVAVEAAFARPTVVTGWHAVSNLPKSQDHAVAAGSVFRLRFTGATPDHAGLERLWRTGLGLRRAEGNGWISLDRWAKPAAVTAPTPHREPDEVERLARELIHRGVAALVMDDLRTWAEDRIVGPEQEDRAEAIVGQRRYRDLTPETLTAFRRALDLPPVEARALSGRLRAWVRTRTSGKKGGSR